MRSAWHSCWLRGVHSSEGGAQQHSHCHPTPSVLGRGVGNPHPADPFLPSSAPCSEFGSAQVVIPQPLLDLTTRRVLTMEWVTGVKLTTLEVG